MENNINVFIIPIWCVSIADIFFILLLQRFHYKSFLYHLTIVLLTQKTQITEKNKTKDRRSEGKNVTPVRLNFIIIQKANLFSCK